MVNFDIVTLNSFGFERSWYSLYHPYSDSLISFYWHCSVFWYFERSV